MPRSRILTLDELSREELTASIQEFNWPCYEACYEQQVALLSGTALEELVDVRNGGPARKQGW